jgi:hypothetical protein
MGKMPEGLFYERLPCQLEAQELLLKSRALAQLLSDQEAIEAEKKDASAEFKRRLDAVEGDLSALGLEVRTGREYREVGCIERADYTDNRVEIIRTDTGEIVRMRPLEPHERQQSLQLGGRAPAVDFKAAEQARPDEFREKIQ